MVDNRVSGYRIEDDEEEVDCGWRFLPCAKLEKIATRKWFLFGTALAPVALMAQETYLADIGKSIFREAGVDATVFEYFSTSLILFQGIVAILTCLQGSRAHNPVWIGSTVCFLGLLTLLSIIPFKVFYAPLLHSTNGTNDISKCMPVNVYLPIQMASDTIFKLVTLGIVMAASVLANVTYILHAVTYIEDNKGKTHTGLNIAIIIAIRAHGQMIVQELSPKVEYFWLTQTIFGTIFVIYGFLISLFPKRLKDGETKPTIIPMQTFQKNGRVSYTRENSIDKSFSPTFKRVITNNLVIIEAIIIGLVYTTVKNFSDYKIDFARTQFHIEPTEDYTDPYTSNDVAKQFKVPLLTLISVLFAFLFKKSKTRRSLFAFISGLGIKLPLMLLIVMLTRCGVPNFAGVNDNGTFRTPQCSSDCACTTDQVKFEPVCLNGGLQTYLSPCQAGCKDHEMINNVILYKNCSCGVDPSLVNVTASNTFTKGSCKDCFKVWTQFQMFSIIVIVAGVTPLIPHAILLFEVTNKHDKLVMLGLVIAIASLIHFFGKILYSVIYHTTCLHRGKDNSCKLNSKLFAILMPVLGMVLCLIAGVTAYLVKRTLPNDDSSEDIPAPTDDANEDHVLLNRTN